MREQVLVRVDSYVLRPNEEDATVIFRLEAGQEVNAVVPIGEVDRFGSTVRAHLIERLGPDVRLLFASVGGRRAMVRVPESLLLD